MSKTSQIVKNSFFLYIRMLLLMVATFFTSRIVLDKLGVVDYGINNVVGGVASMFVFFRSSLSNVTQRYLNFEMGRKNYVGMRDIFQQHLSIYIVIAVVVLLFSETLGIWIVTQKLVIPENRYIATLWVYQFTLLGLIFTISSVVYDSVLIAHENMKVYSYCGIFEGVTKLLIAFLISYSPIDKMIFYAIMLSLVSIGLFFFYSTYCKIKYEECVFRFAWKPKAIKDAFSMVSWNTIGTLVYMINDQGINILLNIFFGPAVNAARAVSYQVSSALLQFSSNFYKSVQPQLVKAYASEEWDYFYVLFYKSSKYAFLLLWIVSLPLMFCVNPVLKIWLKNVPEYANIFTIWILFYNLVNVLNQPIWITALAVGKLKKYILLGSSVFLMIFPISLLSLYMGYSPVSVFVIALIVRLAYLIVVMKIIHEYVNISFSRYLKEVVMPILLVVVSSSLIMYLIPSIQSNLFMAVGSTVVQSIIIVMAAIYVFALTKNEKLKLKTFINKKIHHG